MLGGEQVAVERAAGGLVGVGSDEAGDRGGGGHARLGEQALDLPGGGPVALLGDLFPGGELARRIGGDGEGLQAFEVDLVLAVGGEQLRRDVAEPQALLDGAFGDAEAGRDGGGRGAGAGEGGEGLHLVGRVHGRADDVLREGDLGRRGVGGDQAAGHRHVGRDLAFLGELGEGLVAAAAGDHGVEVGGIVDRLDDEVGEDSERGDGGLHLGRGLEAGIGLAHVLVGERELVEGDEQHVGGALAVGGAHGRLLADGDERRRASLCPPLLSDRRRPSSVWSMC